MGVSDDAQVGEHVLDVGRLGELEAAPLFELDLPVGQLQLQLV